MAGWGIAAAVEFCGCCIKIDCLFVGVCGCLLVDMVRLMWFVVWVDLCRSGILLGF